MVSDAAVLVGGRPADHGQDPVTVPQRVRQPLEQHHGAALGTHEPVRPGVERPASSGRRQHALRRRRRGHRRVQHHHGGRRPARGRSRRRPGCGTPCGRPAAPTNTRVSTVIAGPRSAKRVGDPPGRHAERGAGEAVGPVQGARVAGQQRVVVVRQPHEHTGRRARQRRGRHTGVLDGFPGRSPARAGAAGRSRPPHAPRCRRTRRRNRRRRRGTRPTATPTGRAHPARRRSARRRPSGPPESR